MFKELKILKLSLFAVFLAIIIWQVRESNKISVFFTTAFSHSVGSEIDVFQAGNFDSGDAVSRRVARGGGRKLPRRTPDRRGYGPEALHRERPDSRG